MTSKCEEIKETGLPPGEPGKQRQRTLLCNRGGAEADLIFDYAGGRPESFSPQFLEERKR